LFKQFQKIWFFTFLALFGMCTFGNVDAFRSFGTKISATLLTLWNKMWQNTATYGGNYYHKL